VTEPTTEAPREGDAEKAVRAEARPGGGLAARLWASARGYVSVDTRALSVFRLGLGLLYISSLLRRFGDRHIFYAPDLVLPADFPSLAWNERVLPSPFWSITDAAGVDLGFALAGLVFVLFSLGVFTRLTAVASWLALLALHNRMEFMETGGDIVLLLAAFYAMLLPLGDRYSVDAWLRRRWASLREKSAPDVVRARVAPTFALVLGQWALIYGMNAAAKHGAAWMSGDAVQVALRVDRLNTWLGYLLTGVPWITTAMTYGTIVIEAALPVLLLFHTVRGRALAAALIVALHGGIAATMNVGVFSFAMMSIVPLLLPPAFYDGLERRLRGLRLTLAEVRPDAPAVARPGPVVTLHVGLLFCLAGAVVYQACYERLPIEGYTYPRPEWFTRAADAIRWRQGWTMFAPNPPGESDVIVVDAVTESGAHVDPLQGHISGRFEPMTQMPGTLGQNHFWISYQDRIHGGRQWGRWQGLARFIEGYPEREGRPDERITSFAVYRLSRSTWDPWRWDPREEGAALGRPFFGSDDALEMAPTRTDGVPEASRMTDGALAFADWAPATSLSAVFASRCAYAEFDLGRETTPSAAFIQAYGRSRYGIAGSADGRRWRLIGISSAGQAPDRFHAETIRMRPFPMRYVRVMAPNSDGKASVAELRLYEQDPGLPIEAIERAVAVERRPGASAEAPHREPVLHRPGPEGPCMIRRTEPLLLRPESRVR
jgi:hypothetical protein